MHEYDVTLSVSYMEIYRDEVYDLLVDRESVSYTLTTFRMGRLIDWPHPFLSP